MNEKPHTVKSYEDQLKKLNNDLVEMGANCETALGKAMKAISTNDHKSLRVNIHYRGLCSYRVVGTQYSCKTSIGS